MGLALNYTAVSGDYIVSRLEKECIAHKKNPEQGLVSKCQFLSNFVRLFGASSLTCLLISIEAKN